MGLRAGKGGNGGKGGKGGKEREKGEQLGIKHTTYTTHTHTHTKDNLSLDLPRNREGFMSWKGRENSRRPFLSQDTAFAALVAADSLSTREALTCPPRDPRNCTILRLILSRGLSAPCCVCMHMHYVNDKQWNLSIVDTTGPRK